MTASSFWLLGWRTLWRDLRAGELRLLIVAVTLAVAALTAVGFFADRLKGGLTRDARQLLGGDAVIASDNPTPKAFIDKARSLGLQTSATLGFPTMVRAPDDAPDAGAGREIPEPGGVAGCAAQRRGGGAGRARLRGRASGRLRHAA